MEFVKDKDLNEKLATLLSNFWTLQWKAISDAVEKTSRQGEFSAGITKNLSVILR